LPKIVSINDRAYEQVVDATGKLMQITKKSNSLSSTVTFSVDIIDTLLQKVLIEVNQNSAYREKLNEAIQNKDTERLIRLFFDAVKDW
jgi:hypothetical protein